MPVIVEASTAVCCEDVAVSAVCCVHAIGSISGQGVARPHGGESAPPLVPLVALILATWQGTALFALPRTLR